jgi:hypothetical protein
MNGHILLILKMMKFTAIGRNISKNYYLPQTSLGILNLSSRGLFGFAKKPTSPP